MFSHRTSWNLTPNAFTRAVDAYRRGGKPLLDLTASNPTTVGLRYDEQAILAALADPAALRYQPEPKGLLSARKAVVEYYRERLNPRSPRGGQSPNHSITQSLNHPIARSPDAFVGPDAITLTVSTSEAYSFVFRLLCDPGDEVLVPAPSYPLFEFLAHLQDVRLAPYSLFYDHGWHIDFHSLESRLTSRSRAIILVHPNNPTGSLVKAVEADQLSVLCQRHTLALIVDEVFLDYALPSDHPITGSPDHPMSFAFNPDALTFTLSGISKISGLPQMKLAWIVTSGPQEQVGHALSRLEIIADTYLSMNAPIQLAAPVLLAQRHQVCEQLTARIKANLAELDRQLAQQQPCSRLQVEGGWYVILRVPAIRTDEQLAIELLENTGVLVQPGYFYDFRQDGYLVLSLITPEEEFAQGMRKVLGFVIGNL
ncbi:MAG: pyridoxal phosphate-dependent aminotransferase [Terriglobales bacterium]